ncbi:MAG: GldG family protein [Clostridiales bacterium]|nr:MAG: GldG family protein [Clostridiales bacterium]
MTRRKKPCFHAEVQAFRRLGDNVRLLCFFVENANDYRVVDLNDMVSMSDKYTFLSAEQKITAALENLTSGKKPQKNLLHRKSRRKKCISTAAASLRSATICLKIFPGEYFSYEGVNLMNSAVPDDASALMIFAPQTDFTDEEIANLNAYLFKKAEV